MADKPRTRPCASDILADGSLVELVFDPVLRKTEFAVWSFGRVTIQRQIALGDGTTLVPFSPSNNLIRYEAVLLPSSAEEYASEADLIEAVRRFIRRYLDLSDDFEAIAAYYVLLTWVYDSFNELPYLRLRGDYGTGKTRALLILGSISYKSFFASGASTVSPIFHTLNAFAGTLVFDEADFRMSDEKAELVKILNNGNVRGIPVLRTIVNHKHEFSPAAFQVYGPKIVATRGIYEDRALESRFITEVMTGRRLRADVPINLPDRWKDEARHLRNKLLMFRFRNRSRVQLEATLADPRLEPRLNQILVPLLSVVSDQVVRKGILARAIATQASIISDRGLSLEADILQALAELFVQTPMATTIPLKSVLESVVLRQGADQVRPLTPKLIGSVLRRRLNLQLFKSNGTYGIARNEMPRILELCRRYGVDIPGTTPASPQ